MHFAACYYRLGLRLFRYHIPSICKPHISRKIRPNNKLGTTWEKGNAAAENQLTVTATGQIHLEYSPVGQPLQEDRWVWSMQFGAESLLIWHYRMLKISSSAVTAALITTTVTVRCFAKMRSPYFRMAAVDSSLKVAHSKVPSVF